MPHSEGVSRASSLRSSSETTLRGLSSQRDRQPYRHSAPVVRVLASPSSQAQLSIRADAAGPVRFARRGWVARFDSAPCVGNPVWNPRRLSRTSPWTRPGPARSALGTRRNCCRGSVGDPRVAWQRYRFLPSQSRGWNGDRPATSGPQLMVLSQVGAPAGRCPEPEQGQVQAERLVWPLGVAAATAHSRSASPAGAFLVDSLGSLVEIVHSLP
jgi:hypothetical protein